VRDILTIASCMLNKLFHGWLLALLLLGCLVQAVFLFQSGPEELLVILRESQQWSLAVAFYSTVLLIVVAGSIELPREVQTGTVLFILAKPVTRYHIVLGKISGLFFVGAAVIILQALFAVVILWIRGLPPSFAMLGQLLFILGRIGMLAAAVVLFSTAMPELSTIMFSSMYFAFAMNMDLVDQFLLFSPLPPLPTLALRALYFLVPNFAHLQLAVATSANPAPIFIHSCFAFSYALCYAALLAWLAIWQFSNREFA